MKPLIWLLRKGYLLLGVSGLSACFWTPSFLKEHAELHHGLVVGKQQNPIPTLEHNATQYFTPASCQKVITGFLAYKILGPEFHYSTTLYGRRKGKGLQEVTVQFTGDPTFTNADLYQLLLPLKGKSIRGNFVINHAAFQVPEWSPHWMINDIGTHYASPVSAMILDKNALTLSFPLTTSETLVAPNGMRHINYVSSLKAEKNVVPEIQSYWKGSTLYLSGKIPTDTPGITKRVSVPQSQLLLKSEIEQLLKQLQIQLQGKMIFSQKKFLSSPHYDKINNHDSLALATFLQAAMKQSDNLVFDALYLTLLSHAKPEVKQWEEGDQIIKNYLKETLNLEVEGDVFIDGSGLSRYNRLQPIHLWKILQHASLDAYFVSTLAKPGDLASTLEKRHTLPSALRAKTGTMSGMSCLCGYLLEREEPTIFVMMFSHFAKPLAQIYSLQQEWLEKIAY